MPVKKENSDVGLMFQDRLTRAGVPIAQAAETIAAIEGLIADNPQRGASKADFVNLKIELGAQISDFKLAVQTANEATRDRLETRIDAFRAEVSGRLDKMESQSAEAARQSAERHEKIMDVLGRLDKRMTENEHAMKTQG